MVSPYRFAWGINDTSKLPAAEAVSELVSVVVAHPGLREFQAVLVPTLGGQVEVVVGGVQHVDSPRVRGVSVKNGAARVPVEHADALPVAHADVEFRKVVERRSAFDFLRSERRLVVVVEIVLPGGDPFEPPAHAFLERLELGERRARDRDEARVAVIEVDAEAVEIVRPERAVLAALVPVGREHEVIDDELAPAVEELGQRLRACRPVEDVLLLHLLPRQGAPLATQLVAQPGEPLLLREEFPARLDPGLVRYDPMLPDSLARA